MKLKYDQETDALYVRLVDGERVSRTEQLDTGTLVDIDRLGRVLGIEVLRPARRWPLDEIFTRFGVDPNDRVALTHVFRGSTNTDTRYPFVKPAAEAAVAS